MTTDKRLVLVLMPLAALSCGEGVVVLDVPPGYVRYKTPEVTVAPGESKIFAQWIAAPLETPVDVLDIIGSQTAGGHHALIYSTLDVQPVGTTREWTNVDQLSAAFAGGTAGEGAPSIKLPKGAVLRIPAGRALFVQAHYLNASAEPITGQSVLDVKFAEPSADAKLASFFTSTDVNIELKPLETKKLTVECVIKSDVKLLMFSNHMHEYGKEVVTTLRTGEVVTDVKRDVPWIAEWSSNPNFTHQKLQEPFLLPAGSTLRTECTWNNTETRPLAFPDEMCTFGGFFIGEKDVQCIAGEWLTE
jgi:hypothetical protein